MAKTSFVRFFNRRGEDCNFISSDSDFGKEFTGQLFFPKVSVNLIESQNLFLLEEVTATYKTPQRRKLSGEAELTGGSPIVTGDNTLFETELVVGDTVMIAEEEYEVLTIVGATSMTVSPTPAVTLSTENFYLLDYLWYNQLLSSSDVTSEQVVAEFAEETGKFFFYDVSYAEDVPLITKTRSFGATVTDGSAFSIDPLTGRIVVPLVNSVVSPIDVNLGFSSEEEGVFEETLNFSLRKTKLFTIDAIQDNGDGTYLLRMPYLDYLAEFAAVKTIYLGRNYAGGYQYFDLKVVEVTEDGSSTFITVKEPNSKILSTVNTGTLSSYKISLTWDELLLSLTVYGEAEAEDERLRLTLENFGRKIDEEKEYIFRDSDIKEELTDFRLLNKKRKEMLLEGDKIFPYMGSYKGLINILNLFGYYDVAIKEYFLNVDDTSLDKGKFLAIPIAKTSEQKKIIKKIWELVPSKIYKKTSLFGLYYKLNKKSGEYDEFGVPLVVDDSQFTAEEVLIKLFGLKELLKKEYLPLNARIYDITGEGLYFERYNFETWSDNVDVRVLDIGKRPTIVTYPDPVSYIRDLRRVDEYYVEKWEALGFTGFLGPDSTTPGLTVNDSTFFIAEAGYVVDEIPTELPHLTITSGAFGTTASATGASGTIYSYSGTFSGFFSGQSIFVQSTGPNSGSTFVVVANNGTDLQVTPAPVSESGAFSLIDADTLSFWYSSPGVTLSQFYPFWTGSFNDYNRGAWTYRDPVWDTMPPGVYDPSFNVKASYLKALPDDPYVEYPAGAPLLIETLFELFWDECDFSWDQVSLLSQFLADFSVAGATATITDIFSDIADRGFVNGDDVTIYGSPFDGTYQISGVTGSSFVITLGIEPDLIAGKLSYSVDISQISSTTNRLSWDTIGRGEYLDMRVLIEKYGDTTYLYDSGRLPIDNFAEAVADVTTGLTYHRVLDTVILPYAGEYDVSVYIYDITNSFTLSTKQYTVETPKSEITAVYQSQEVYDDWDNIDMKWTDVAFDWYYPAQSISVWQNADCDWDSLQMFTYRDQELKKNKYLLDVLEIDREAQTVLIEGLYADSPHITSAWDKIVEIAQRGKFLYFERTVDEPSFENYEIPAAGISTINSTTIQLTYTGSDLELYARVLLKKTDDPFYEVSPGNFLYADVIGITGSTITLKAPDEEIEMFETYWASNPMFMDSGVYSGTYAIEISASKEVGQNTLFYLNDAQKELFKLDGYFQIFLTDYDVDYAEQAIGLKSMNYENLPDAQWDTFDERTELSQERHSITNAGYLITNVAAGAMVQVEDYEPFFFSGDEALNNSSPAWFFEKAGLHVAVDELNSSTNDGIRQFEYELYPSWPIFVSSTAGNRVYVQITAPTGSSSIVLSETPATIFAVAQIGVTISSGVVVAASLIGSGNGYLSAPVITVEAPASGTQAVLSCTLDSGGRVQSVSILDNGSGYTSTPEVTVEPPHGYDAGITDMVWVGREWRKVITVGESSVSFDTPLEYSVPEETFLYTPYNYHKQIYADYYGVGGYTGPKILSDFYFFIVGKTKTPSLNSLMAVTFDDGTEGEWYDHPERTYSYPLKNTLLHFIGGFDLTTDAQYQYWKHNGKDFPVDGQSNGDSRVLYAGSFVEPFTYSDAVITPYAFQVKRTTPVVFHDDATKLPMKRERVWKVYNEETGEVQVEATSKKLFWNFYRKGKYSVRLEVKDNKGNVSEGTKKAFVIVT